MPPLSLNLVDLDRKFYKLPSLACGRYKPVRQSVEMTLHPSPREEFLEDGRAGVLHIGNSDHSLLFIYLFIY